MKKIIFILLIIFLFPVVGKAADSYKYNQKKDTVEEQKKFVARLNEDKNKCNLAIENTKILIDKSRTRNYLPELYLRLAELYIEKSRLVYFLHRAEKGDSVKSLEQLESNGLKKQAIEIYQQILNNFPKFADRDKVHFFMAHEYRELSQLDDMIKQYRAIITEHPNSSYVPEAYLLLGDYFFNQQDLDMAQRDYQNVLNYPQSSAIAIARYKLAWCYINRTDFKKALKLFEEAVTSAAQKSQQVDTYKRVDVRLEALLDMAYCYPECYKKNSPHAAIDYFEKFAWSRPVYTQALEKLAYRYLIKNKWHHAAAIYRRLSSLKHDAEKLLEYSHSIFKCVKAQDRFEAADQDVAIMIRALRAQKYSVHIPDKEKEKNMADYELYARDIITHLHHKAREDKSEADFARAADSYKLYLDFFDQSPAYREMEANYAEALFSSKQYLEAGQQYEKLAKALEKKQRKNKLYSAVISYYNALKQKKNLNYYQIAQAREGLKTVGKAYASDFPASDRVPDVLFNVAWITYDEGKYDEAIAEFSKFVEQYPKGKEARAAIHLILDAFHLKEDYEGLARYGHNILNNEQIADLELKKEVKNIVTAAESKVVYSLTLSAVNDWDKGRKGVFDFVKQQGSSSMSEQALYALILPSKEKGDLKTLFSVGSRLINEYPASPQVEDTMRIMIDSSLRIAQFRLLVQYLEEFAARFAKHSDSLDFLYQAAHIRETLGQYKLANKDYQLFLNRISKSDRRKEPVVLAMADNAQRIGNNGLAIKVLTSYKQSFSTIGQIKAEAAVADLYFQNAQLHKAQKYRKKAQKAYKPKLARQDKRIKSIMAGMEFHAKNNFFRKYMDMKFRKSIIDTKLASAKVGLLEDLEKGYNRVIQYQSPEWALAACYRSFEINKEFARFLKESPVPADLSAQGKKQYVEIINQKAQDYTEKANQYLRTCLDHAHTWGICDAKLASYFINPSEQKEGFSSSSSVEITTQCLKDSALSIWHNKLMPDPNNVKILLNLAEAYQKKSDFKLSILIAQKALQTQGEEQGLRARAYSLLGLSYLYSGDDRLAKDAFNQALKLEPQNIGAKLNLAGLYRYYGHTAKADKLYQTLPDQGMVEKINSSIHPKAREFYHAYIKACEKLPEAAYRTFGALF